MAYRRNKGLPLSVLQKICFCLLLTLAGSSTAVATTATATFQVSTTVLDICSVTASAMTFANYSAPSGTPDDATSTVTVTCSAGLTYTVGLDEGTTAGAAVDDRMLADGNSNVLSYAIYTTSAHDTIWADGSGSTATRGGTGNGLGQPYTAYGRITTAQFVPSGIYTDTITATVTY